MSAHIHTRVETHRGFVSEMRRFQAPLSWRTLSVFAVRMQCSEDPQSGAKPQPTAQDPRALLPWCKVIPIPSLCCLSLLYPIGNSTI